MMTARHGAWVFLALLALTACGGSGGSRDAGPGGPTGPGPGTGPVAEPEHRLDTDAAGAELSLIPEICCEDGALYVVWYDRRSGDLDVHFNASEDGGATWRSKDVRLDTDVAGDAGSLIPQICCAGNAVYVVWFDERSGDPDIHFNRSLDRGRTWLSQDIRLDRGDAGAAQSRDPQICCDGQTVVVTWEDNRDGAWGVYMNRSADAGTTWLAADVEIDRGTPAVTNARYPQVACAGANVTVVWTDDRDGGTAIYANRSTDGAQTFAPVATRLDRASGAGDADFPVVACEGGRSVVAFQDARDGLRDIYVNHTAAAGASWLSSAVRVDRGAAGSGDSIAPQVCMDGDRVFLVWEDSRVVSPDVYFSRSLDGGATWPPADTRLDTALGAFVASFRPQVCCRGERVTVTWYDDREGRFDVLLRTSPDAGGTWSDPETRMDDDEAGAGDSLAPQVCCDGERAFVVWYDQRDGPGDVYFSAARFL